MSIETWAKKVAEAMRVMPRERPSFAAVLVDFIDEYDELAANTKLAVPVFARALTTAGLTSASGGPCDANALRVQIKRARERRRSLRDAADHNSASATSSSAVSSDIHDHVATCSPHIKKLSPPSNRGSKHAAPSVLIQLEQSKPKKVRPLNAGENGI